MAQAFYRKWRSQDFDELVGQDHVTRTLLGALRTNRISHAYLFCGPRGTGKTSTARILAKAINCQTNEGRGQPCNTCAMCQAITDGRAIDLIEMDAASNRGIDDIRELRDRVNFAPNEARYKIYIIDEVHQLTPAAFDALLKTLEEPPRHVIFILATTEAHEVPATILSRCQRFDFRRISTAAATARLQHICDREEITIDPAALQMIVRSAGGSLRDSENLLDQVASFYGQRIEVEHVRETLGLPDAELVRRLVAQIIDQDITGGLHTINEVVNQGDDLRHFGKLLLGYLRNILLIQADAERWTDLPLVELEELRDLAERTSLTEVARIIRAFSFSETKLDDTTSLPLELALVEALTEPVAPVRRGNSALDRPTPGEPRRPARPLPAPTAGARVAEPSPPNGFRTEAIESRPDRVEEGPVRNGVTPVAVPAGPPNGRAPAEDLAATDPPVETALPDQSAPPEPLAAAAPPVNTAAGWPGDDVDRLRSGWSRVLEQLKDPRRRTVQALLRNSCEPTAVQDGRVVLSFRYKYHKEKIEEADNRRYAEEALSALLGAPHRVECVLITGEAPDKLTAAREDPLVQAAVKEGAELRSVS